MTTKSAKPTTVFVLQLQPIAAASAKDEVGVPVSPTTLVYGTEDALMQGLRRILAAEYKRLKGQEEFERELGGMFSFREWDLSKWYEFCQLWSDYNMLLVGLNTELPSNLRCWNVTVAKERVLY